MKFVRSLGLVIAGVALATSCATTVDAGGSGAQPPATSSGQAEAKAVEQLQFTAKTVDGKEFSGQSLAGKPAVLWFWAPWCPTCQREAPTVAKAAGAHTGVTFVGVAAQDEVSAMREFVSKYEVGSFAHLADTDASVWKRFGVTAQPAFAFIGADGSVEVVKGTVSEQDLAERIGKLAAA